MPYWRLFYHLVWSTKRRAPLIDATIDDLLRRSLSAKCHDLKIVVHAIGTMPDHVHLALSIPPSIAIATAVGQLKGTSSHLINQSDIVAEPFSWETEYAALSFGARNLDAVVAYINNQPQRHATHALWTPMEPAPIKSKTTMQSE